MVGRWYTVNISESACIRIPRKIILEEKKKDPWELKGIQDSVQNMTISKLTTTTDDGLGGK